jgi:tetratricopeptide (TPR) repeat protein
LEIAMTNDVPTAKIFISYRREDSADITGRVYDRLVEHFGKDAVFKDVDDIPFGANFKSHLQDILAQCAVELVVIGPRWLDATDDDGRRRLDDPADFVRIEVESGLSRGIPVIPLLVYGASMPGADRLPPSLAELAYRNGIPVRPDPDFHKDMGRLVRQLEEYVPPRPVDLETLAAAASAAVSLHQLPSPPADFTGRTAELAEIQVALEGHGGATICGLRGLGGIGKTALALKLAEELTPRYPDAQFFLDLKGTSPEPLSVADAMAHVIRAYHPTAKLPESESELSGLYRSVLHDQRALLLMDNAASAEQINPLIPPAGCMLLVTSRRHFTLPGLYAKNLDTLPPDDTRALLLRIAARIGEYASELARLCGYLPLALRLAGSALAERADLSPADYLRRLADAQTRLGLVDASFDLSYQLLDAEMRHLWRMLAIFPDTFDRLAVGAVWELEPDPAQDALSELVRYSMVAWDPVTRCYRLHDLARLFADVRLEEVERALGERRHAVHYMSVAHAARELYEQGSENILQGLALFDLEWDNIQAGQAWAVAHAGEDETAAQLCNAYPDAGAHCLQLRQHPQQQIDWLEAAVVAARRLNDRRGEGNRLGNLGNAYADLGEVRRAIEYHQQALASPARSAIGAARVLIWATWA